LFAVNLILVRTVRGRICCRDFILVTAVRQKVRKLRLSNVRALRIIYKILQEREQTKAKTGIATKEDLRKYSRIDITGGGGGGGKKKK